MVASSEPVEYLVQHVREALAADDRVAELGIEVDIRGSDVYLRGTVATQQRRRVVEEVARDLLGDRAVHNEIEVEEIADSETPEQLA